MRGVHRVEAMLDAELYEAWQEYLQYYRRTGQRELRWLVQRAVDTFYEEMRQQRLFTRQEAQEKPLLEDIIEPR